MEWKKVRSEGQIGHETSRRNFLKASALAAAAAGLPAVPRAGGGTPGALRGNSMPGRIVMYQDDQMAGHTSSIDRDFVEQVVHWSVRALTGHYDIGEAFESLFEDVHAGSTFAIKVNCIGPTDTRWEVVRGIVSGLSLMFGGTYDVSQVTIYDRHNLHSHGYDESEFTFNGHYPLISHTQNPGSYYVYGSHRLSQYLVDCDYVINVPVLKSHSDTNNQITAALKNHYGSCYPSSLCGQITGMLTISADQYVKPKTCLVVQDAVRATYTGGPGEMPQTWSTFPAGSPNLLFFSTDPVTNEYWARETINTERTHPDHGWEPKPCPWVETAAEDPWNLGICNPDDMDLVVPTDVPEDSRPFAGATFLAPSAPNPFSQSTTLRFHLGRAGAVRLAVTDAAGRVVRHLVNRMVPAGPTNVRWDGRDESGQLVPAGVYFAHFEADGGRQARKVIVSR